VLGAFLIPSPPGATDRPSDDDDKLHETEALSTRIKTDRKPSHKARPILSAVRLPAR
jgi:hypothetical protein